MKTNTLFLYPLRKECEKFKNIRNKEMSKVGLKVLMRNQDNTTTLNYDPNPNGLK